MEADFEAGFNAYKNGDYKTAKEHFIPLSKAKNLYAKAGLARMYEEGLGVKKNLKKAFELYKSAAYGGIESCFANVGYCYEWGKGIKSDLNLAFQYYAQGAEKGDLGACYNLATLFMQGKGVEKDIFQATKYLEYAAQRGDGASLYSLGLMYLQGEELEQDIPVGIQFLEMAADVQFVPAMRELGLVFFEGNFLDPNLEEAWIWFNLSRSGGDPEGQANCFKVKARARETSKKINSEAMMKRSFEMHVKIYGQA